MIRDPIEFKKAMLDAKHEFEVDMERQSWPPSPPLKPGRRRTRSPRRRRPGRQHDRDARRPAVAAPVAAAPHRRPAT